MNDGDRSVIGSTALTALPSSPEALCTDRDLQERAERAAAALGHPPPILLPGAAALVMPVPLPLKTARQRMAALPFAVEPFLSEPLDQMELRLGPQLAEGTWLCVAMSRTRVTELTGSLAEDGAVFPDTLAVPLPSETDAWGLWCGPSVLHIRLACGTGLVVKRESFAAFWRASGSPVLEVFHGDLPLGVTGTSTPPPPVDAAILQIDFRLNPSNTRLRRFQKLGRFAAIVALATGLAQIGLMRVDAVLLGDLARAETKRVEARLADLGFATGATAPLRLVEAEIAQRSAAGADQDHFLGQLAAVMRATPDDPAIRFRDMRFDGQGNRLTLQVEAADFQSLQRVETALRQAGLPAQGGAATQNEGGAEMQITVAGSLQ